MEPEYLSLFSNAGGTAVSVHFTDNDGSIREQLMHPHELTKLIGHDEQGFLAQMFFDEQLMRLDRIEILVGKNQVILHVRYSVSRTTATHRFSPITFLNGLTGIREIQRSHVYLMPSLVQSQEVNFGTRSPSTILCQAK